MGRFAMTLCALTTIVACSQSSDTKENYSPHARKTYAGGKTDRLCDTKCFESLLQESLEELKLESETHKSWGLGSFERWDLDQETGLLVFSNADGTKAECPAQIIGSFNTSDNTWLWAWGNPSILDPLKRDALRVKAYGEKHGIEQLTARKWVGTESDAWAMTALAMKLCDARGAYRGPSGQTYVYLTFKEVRLSKPE